MALHSSDVTSTLRPTRNFVSQVTSRVVRGGSRTKPGFAVIPDSKSVLGTKERVGRFQRRLIESMIALLRKSRPSALRRQDYLAVPDVEAAKQYRRARRCITELDIDGLSSLKEFHMDVLQHLYVSVCYGPNRNVRGGTPLFVDLLDLVEGSNSLGLLDVLELDIVTEKYYVESYHPRARVPMLKSSAHSLLHKHNIIRIEGLQFGRLPIVVFSNRLEDGLVHGATRIAKKRTQTSASRPIAYVAIADG